MGAWTEFSVTIIELHLASVRQITIDFKEGRRLGHPIHEMGHGIILFAAGCMLWVIALGIPDYLRAMSPEVLAMAKSEPGLESESSHFKPPSARGLPNIDSRCTDSPHPRCGAAGGQL